MKDNRTLIKKKSEKENQLKIKSKFYEFKKFFKCLGLEKYKWKKEGNF
jgi:hypothetical protein